jgi:hypothetical protein
MASSLQSAKPPHVNNSFLAFVLGKQWFVCGHPKTQPISLTEVANEHRSSCPIYLTRKTVKTLKTNVGTVDK